MSGEGPQSLPGVSRPWVYMSGNVTQKAVRLNFSVSQLPAPMSACPDSRRASSAAAPPRPAATARRLTHHHDLRRCDRPARGPITLGSLIQVAGVFRLPERLVRTSVARLANEGWLAGRKEGRQSEYRLAPGGEQRFAEATRRIYGLPLGGLGRPMDTRDPTAGRRHASARGAPLVGLRPALRRERSRIPTARWRRQRRWLEDIEGAEGALCLRSSSNDLGVDRQLVARGWISAS